MIIITYLNETSTHVMCGDTFNPEIEDGLNSTLVINEEITVQKEINFVASYRFALEDGTCPGFHLCGIFANKDELPLEFKNAKMLDELTGEQFRNFERTVGTIIKK